MWLLPILSPAARLLTRIYHRLTVAGGSVPPEGPVLIVANHPNSLIDPAVVVGVAGRPVQFMAKHSLFSGEAISWIVRGAGSIPVYRRSDAAELMHQNEEAFSAVFEALQEGSAVGIFPEGMSHSGSGLVPLKTGAARIALGAALRLGGAFPIVPIGLTFERRDTFRSEGLVLIGRPPAWEDLARSGPEDAAAVRELTARIDLALRRVTVNLESWDDLRIVHAAEAVHAAETGADPHPRLRILRLKEITDLLRELRREDDDAWRELARELARHDRLLRALRLRASDLRRRPGLRAVVRWTARNVPFVGIFGLLLVLLGSALFWVPYRLVAVAEGWMHPQHDTRSTYKLVIGIVAFTLWWLILSAVAAAAWGWPAGALTALGLPLLGYLTLELQERWSEAIADARRFWLHRFRPGTIRKLADAQRRLGEQLQALYSDRRERGMQEV